MLKIYNGSQKDIGMRDMPSFVIGDNLFAGIQEYVRKNKIEEGACFSVVDKNGKQLFFVTYLEDMIWGIKRKDLSDYVERFDDIDNLDFTLLDRYQRFFFLNVDNYSVALAKLLLKYRPDKKIIFGDARARYFFGHGKVKYVSRIVDAGRNMELTEEWMRGSVTAFFDRIRAFIGWKTLGMLQKRRDCCVVMADRVNHPLWERMVYNSQNMVYSLIWKKRKSSLGEENPEKKIVILDYACDNEGVGSIARNVFAHIMWMSERGYVPVMHLHTSPNQYLVNPGENMWDYFFEPVSPVSVEEAYKSKNVIVATENDITWYDAEINPYKRESILSELDNSAEFRKIVRLNQETKQHIDAKMPKEIREAERVLGVILRGTGFRKDVVKSDKDWWENVVEPDSFLRACRYYKEKLNCEYIFLATEDEEYFELAQKILGDDIVFVDQKRSSYDYANSEIIALNEAMGVKDGKKAGRDYLSVIQSLIECKALLYNVDCGAVRLARLWKPDAYELFQLVKADWEKDISG